MLENFFDVKEDMYLFIERVYCFLGKSDRE